MIFIFVLNFARAAEVGVLLFVRNFMVCDNVFYLLLCNSQKHDIIKKRLDSHGNVIETRQEGIGAPKVNNTIVFVWIYVVW